MKFIAYIFAYSFVWLLHLLPERILYLLSDLLYLLMYYVAGYRKKVVHDNLEMAFPEYDKSTRRHIARKFYHHLSDLMLEQAVYHFYSESKALQKISYKNPELLNELYAKGEEPEILDKEFFRGWLMKEKNYMGDGPVPEIPDDIRAELGIRYVESYETITGEKFVPSQGDIIERIKKNLNL